MRDKNSFDIVIIGAGPAGYPAAVRAAAEGAAVAIIEKDRPGGTCLNKGCIPTKYFIGATSAGKTDWPALVAEKDRVVGELVAGIEFLWEKKGIKYIPGTGYVEGPGCVRCESAADGAFVLTARKGILWAPGSVSAEILGLAVDHEYVLDSDDLAAGGADFASCVIVGGGAVGLEWASIMARTGVAVTVVEMMPSLLPGLDEDVAKRLAVLLKRSGVKVLTDAKVAGLEVTDRARVRLEGGETLDADRVLVAVGRRAAVNAAEAQQASVELAGGRLVVKDTQETTARGIYAAGDAAGRGPMLAHLATREGLAAVANILGKGPVTVDYDAIPWAVFTDPECAGVGLTEAEAAERGIKARVGRMDYRSMGRPRTDGETEGFVKIVAEEGSGRLLGAAAVGRRASETVQLVTAAMSAGGTVTDLSEMMAVHPTYCEVVQEAALDWFGRALHKL